MITIASATRDLLVKHHKMTLKKDICELKIDETAYCRKIMLEGGNDKEVVTAMHAMQK